MKLKDTFITKESDDAQIMVSAEGSGFSGFVRSNATAAFIVDCLKENTTKDGIVDKMCARYDAPRAVIEESVEDIVEKLRSIGALEE